MNRLAFNRGYLCGAMDRVKDGGILLSVHSNTSDETKRAKAILEGTGAQDISSTGEAAGEKTDVPVSRVA